MHKKIFNSIFLIAIIFLFQGCADVSDTLTGTRKKDIVAYVGEYEITVDDFNAYRNKVVSTPSPLTVRQKRRLLNNLIDRQLLIQEAVNENVDKEANFIQEIEVYWQQGLIKRVLDKKTKEIAGKVKVYKREKEAYYQNMFGKRIFASILFLNDENEARAVANLKNAEQIHSYIRRKPKALLDFREGQIEPTDLPFKFAKEIYSIQAGEFTKPVKVTSTLWMVGYVKKRFGVERENVPEFSEVESEIQTAIRRQKEIGAMETWLNELKSNKKISINEGILLEIE